MCRGVEEYGARRERHQSLVFVSRTSASTAWALHVPVRPSLCTASVREGPSQAVFVILAARHVRNTATTAIHSRSSPETGCTRSNCGRARRLFAFVLRSCLLRMRCDAVRMRMRMRMRMQQHSTVVGARVKAVRGEGYELEPEAIPYGRASGKHRRPVTRRKGLRMTCEQQRCWSSRLLRCALAFVGVGAGSGT